MAPRTTSNIKAIAWYIVFFSLDDIIVKHVEFMYRIMDLVVDVNGIDLIKVTNLFLVDMVVSVFQDIVT